MHRFVVLLLASMPGAALAECNFEAAHLISWSLSPDKGTTTLFVSELGWIGEVMVKDVDGEIQFDDENGARLWSYELTRDQVRIPGRTFFENGDGDAMLTMRLMDVTPQDVTVQVCVRGYVTDDGQIVRFDG